MHNRRHITSEKKKKPRMSPQTTVRYDMAVADDASTSRSAAVKATPPPYAKHPAPNPNF
jgi:hypothetical protein